MGFVDETIDVAADTPAAYALWLDYEDYPRFMPAVENVRVVGYGRLHWRGAICGGPLEWDTDVTAHVEDTRVRWEATDGRETGEVTFEKLDAGTTRVHYQLEFDAGLWDDDSLAVRACMEARVRDDLREFKRLVEALD